MEYERPYIITIEVIESDTILSVSDVGPGATDVGSPSVGGKSVWDT